MLGLPGKNKLKNKGLYEIQIDKLAISQIFPFNYIQLDVSICIGDRIHYFIPCLKKFYIYF